MLAVAIVPLVALFVAIAIDAHVNSKWQAAVPYLGTLAFFVVVVSIAFVATNL